MSTRIVPIMDPHLDAPVEPALTTVTEVSGHAATIPTNIRGTSVSVSVPLDHRPVAVSPRKILRRDSLDRREALLKGKEGSRQRRRWENDRLLNNPHAEPPLPQDWEVRPTYPVRRIPYYLAPLWDAAEFQRAVESKLKGRRGTKSAKRRAQSGMGVSPFEEAASSIPKEIRSRLKHARSAKGMLQDLEENVRQFLSQWNEQERRLRQMGLHDAPRPKHHHELPHRPKTAVRSDSAIHSDSEDEDEEIVFVGRAGATIIPDPSPTTKHEQSIEYETLLSDLLVHEGLEDDKAAGFGRWLTHCIGSYYGLRTWSVTTNTTIDGDAVMIGMDAGERKMRQAYVGIDERVRGWMGSSLDSGRDFELPRPLWTMV